MRCRSSLLLPQSGLCDLDQPSPVLGAKQTARCGSTAPESQPDSQLLRDSQFVRLKAEKSPGWNLARPSRDCPWLRKNEPEPRMRRIVFSIVFSHSGRKHFWLSN